MTGTPPDWLADGIARLVQAQCPPGSRAANVAEMEEGHAGLTFGFDVLDAGGGRSGSYVIKLAPRGVVRRGNTDVYRQAPLLRALHGAGLPVPAVPWAAPDEALFGTPYVVMERLPGRIFLIWEPHASFGSDPQQIRSLWLQAARLLARLHRVDWRQVLRGWEAPRPLTEELGRWGPVLKHAQEPAWLAAGTALGARLAAALPEEQPVGLVHGDFQPGNILYQDGQAKGLIDWELSCIGAQGLDVGWLMMMADGPAWDASYRPVAPVSSAELLQAYAEAGGPATAHIDWYRGLAAYRMGAIACLNVKLHRTGKRVDALWERFAPSIASLFERGSEVLAGTASQSANERQ